jgi:hypothetical protein
MVGLEMVKVWWSGLMVLSMKANGSLEEHKALASSNMWMEMFSRVTGTEIKLMASVNI